MVTHEDVQHLREQLEQLRKQLNEGCLEEQDVWTVMKRASTMLDEAAGSPLEECIEVIFELLSSIWNNKRNQARLMDMHPGSANG